METVLANVAGRVRRVIQGGRNYYVAPATLIVPGVLSGSQGALYYPPHEVADNPAKWNGMPLTVYHPTDPITNEHLSAQDPGVLSRQGVGVIRHTRYQGKLLAEAWFDAAKTARVDNRLPPESRILPRLKAGQPIELSTGLYTENVPAPAGAKDQQGRPYDYIAKSYRPDHVAVLPDQIGACSVQDGCGVLVNSGDGSAGFDSDEQRQAFFGLKEKVDRKGRKAVLGALSGKAQHLEDIAQKAGLTQAATARHLMHPELEDQVTRWPGNRFTTKIKKPTGNAEFVNKMLEEEGADVHPGQGKKTENQSFWSRLGMAFGLVANALPTANATPNQPRHAETGQYLPHGAGTGKGPVHMAAQTGHQATDQPGDSYPPGDAPAQGYGDPGAGGGDGRGLATVTRDQDPPDNDLDDIAEDDHPGNDANPKPLGTKRDNGPDGQRVSNAGGYAMGMNDAHQATKQAAGASVMTEHEAGVKHALAALGASAKKDCTNAIASHQEAAGEHEDAATAARQDGNPVSADDHDRAAALHRKAASMHRAYMDPGVIHNTSLADMPDAERRAAAATMDEDEGSTKASAASKKANRTGKSEHHEAAASAHREAAKSHAAAAKAHEAAGRTRQAAASKAAAKAHRAAAKEHTSKITGNRGTPMTRDQLLARLTANCQCEEDKAAFNRMSEETLWGVWNAKAEGSNADATAGTGSKQAGGEEDDDYDNEGEERDKNTSGGRMGQADEHTENFLKSIGFKDLNEAQAVLANARQIERDRRRQLVGRLQFLADNTADPRRKSLIVNKLKGNPPLGYLEELLTLLEPTANQQTEYPLAPYYLGAAGGLAENYGGTNNTDEDMILPLTINALASDEGWAPEHPSRRRQQA